MPHPILALTVMLQDPQLATLQVPTTATIARVHTTDVDGDGVGDLVVATRGKRPQRALQVHRGQGTAPWFANEPTNAPYAIERDVVAAAFADVHARPGRELVLFTAEQAVAVLPGADGSPDYVPLFAHRLVWPASDVDTLLLPHDVVLDLDGDGRDDFLLPEPDGARFVLQRGAADARTFDGHTVALPAKQNPLRANGGRGGPASANGNELRLQLSLGGGDDGDMADDDLAAARGMPDPDSALVRLRTRTPRWWFGDLRGDGRRTAAALRNDALWTWGLGAGGPSAATPIPLPLPEDRLGLVDPAFDVQLADVDGDGPVDLVLTTTARRNDELEVRVDLFAARGGDTPWSGKPDGRLRLQTLAMPPQLVDADGDGKLDLVAVTVRTDLLRGLTEDAASALQGQLTVFRGQGRRFVVPAMLTQVLELPPPKRGPASPFVRVLPGAGGEPGAVLLRAGDHVQRQPLQRSGDTLLLGAPDWSLRLGDEARLRWLAPSRQLVVASPHELHCVRFER